MVGERDAKKAFLFLLPLSIVFFVFLVLPIFIAIGISFTEYDILSSPSFVGFQNFLKIFRTKRVLGIFLTTFKLSIILVVLHGSIGLLLALLVNSVSKKIQNVMRLLLYAPVAITTASMAIAWKYMFNRDFGVINWVLQIFNIEHISWLTSSVHVTQSIAIFSIWKFVGNAFLFYFIGLSGIPKELYEVADIDGAGPLVRFTKVTLPMLSPTIFFVIMVLFISTLQIFDEPFFLTRGGPGDASRTVNLFIYEIAFQQYDMGYSSAVAVLLFITILALTILQNKLSKKWVNYDR